MLGDLRYMLSGSQLWVRARRDVYRCVGEATIVDEDYAQRLFAAELEIVVRASVQIVDEDLETDPEIWIERFDTGTVNSESFDPRNYVASGYRFAPQTGLSAAPTEGAAFIGGQLVTSIPSVVTLPDNAVIFRDLPPTGQLVYRALSIAEYSANGEPCDNRSNANWRYSNRSRKHCTRPISGKLPRPKRSRSRRPLQGVTCNQDREHLQSRRIPASKYSAQKVPTVSFWPTLAKRSSWMSSCCAAQQRVTSRCLSFRSSSG